MDLLSTKEMLGNWLEELGTFQARKQHTELKISTKENPADLVTQIDKDSENWLIEKIHSSFPSHSIWGEEGGFIKRNSHYVWIMDPLDGTMNYTHGLPLFGISLALQYRGETILGGIHFPRLAETYLALKGKGAQCNGKEIKVSPEKDSQKALLGISIPYPKIAGKVSDDYLAPFHSRLRGIRTFGCVVFDLCQLARGNLDVSLALKMNPWDVLGGMLIIKEAGGDYIHQQVSDSHSLLSANPTLLSRLKNDRAFSRLLEI